MGVFSWTGTILAPSYNGTSDSLVTAGLEQWPNGRRSGAVLGLPERGGGGAMEGPC